MSEAYIGEHMRSPSFILVCYRMKSKLNQTLNVMICTFSPFSAQTVDIIFAVQDG